jgi:triosephosphate isomerase
MKKKIIVGNWKMNPTTLDEAKRIYKSTKASAGKLKNVTVVACPPFIYTSAFLKSKTDSSLAIGVQNAYFEPQGSFTGEISPLMIKDLGVKYAIIGHSERRVRGETDEMIAKKVQLLLETGIKVILCVGEKTRNEDGSHLDFIKDQIKSSLDKVNAKNIGNLLIAYEPVWAIGAKEAMDSASIYEMTLFIKKVLSDLYGHEDAISTPVLYGGSVNFRNASEIFITGKVDGLLVGRESVNPPGFAELLKAVDSI